MKKLNDCFCCEGIALETPKQIHNRPGLNEITCRVGTHSSFKRSMLAELSTSALSIHQTREDSDFAIALCDGCSTMLDVLTFYNERITHENYLRTADEKTSLVHLTRLVGYRPHPGLAASTYLAFSTESSSSSPEEVEIPKGTQAQSIPGQDELPQTFETDRRIVARPEWNEIRVQSKERQIFGSRGGVSTIYLKGESLQLGYGDVLLFSSPFGYELRKITNIEVLDELGITKITINRSYQSALLIGIQVFRQQAAIFGHNAPDWKSLSNETRANYRSPAPDPSLDTEWPNMGLNSEIEGNKIDLDRQYADITSRNSKAVLYTDDVDFTPATVYSITGVSEITRPDFALSTRITQLKTFPNPDWSGFSNSRRTLKILCQSEELELAKKPIIDVVDGDVLKLALNIGNFSTGQLIAISGKTSDGSYQTEVRAIAQIRLYRFTNTVLTLNRSLEFSYLRTTVTVNANVVRATHGETVEEYFSGNAGLVEQRFNLKQGPLTYTDSMTVASGVKSSLQLEVDGIRWSEAPHLHNRKAGERIFKTISSEKDVTTVQFNSTNRPFTGQENITATYRKGVGRDGLVDSGAISLIRARPLGVKDVKNVSPGKDAQDPEDSDMIRDNAPLTVLTLDRLVSLKDYENISKAFGGIEKSLATWTWNGERRSIMLTIAGTDGAGIDTVSSNSLGARLIAVINQFGVPFVPVQVKSFRQTKFRVSGTLIVNNKFSPERVKTEVQETLLEHFSYKNRRIGYPVALSELISLVQRHSGVAAVDIDYFHRSSDRPDAIPGSLLRANVPTLGTREKILRGAELLVLDPDGVDFRTAI